MTPNRKQALGKGLGALLGGGIRPDFYAAPLPTPPESIDSPASGQDPMAQVPLDRISPNPRQPRQHFDQEKLEELAASIKEHGLLQPVLITKGEGPNYILLAGERRLRASQMAGLESIPARVVEATDAQQLEFAIIENVQRDDLNPVEEAHAYQELASVFGYSQDQIAQRVGKSRVAVANALRLLKLNDHCLRDLQTGALTPGHARAILMLHHPLQQEALREEILNQGMTVRQAEDRARQIQQGESSAPPPGAKKNLKTAKVDLDVVALEQRLVERLGCPVSIKTRGNSKGKLEITYNSLDDLDRILEIVGVSVDH